MEADLLDSESMSKAIEGCKFVVHTASPFPVVFPKDEQTLIKPAVEGTMAAMRACHRHKVERIVITSSCAACMKSADKKKTHFTSDDWTDCNIATAYEKSKTMAEKAAWNYLASLPEGERFECATVNPGLVFGPNINECSFSSGDIIRKVITGGMPGMPNLMFPLVDVRDVAQAHLEAILRPEANGKRFLMVANSVPFVMIGEWLYEKWGERFKVVHKTVPDFVIKIISLWDGECRAIKDDLGKNWTFDHTPAEEVLGIKFRDLKDTVQEMSDTLI